MTSLSLAVGRATLADKVFSRNVAIDVVLITAGAAFTTLLTQIAIPMWPVPITGQTLAVLLVGTTLGATRGALSLSLYLVLGVLGLPVFAAGGSGSLLDRPSGGFIIGYVLAAALVGLLAQNEWDRRGRRIFIAFLAGTAVIYLVGLPWLYVSLDRLGPSVWNVALGYDSLLAATIGSGFVPFIIGDVLKALLAGVLIPLAWRSVNRLDQEKLEQL